MSTIDTTSARSLARWAAVVHHRLRSRMADGDADPRALLALSAIDGSEKVGDKRRARAIHMAASNGWATEIDGTWRLTDAGTAEKKRLADGLAGVDALIQDAVSPEDLDTTVATLEKLATALDLEDDDEPAPHGEHGPGFRRPPFGRRGFEFGFGGDFGHHGHHGHHGRRGF
ncbi:hypothetical protein [Microbacterium indicum]|uniref:hypothetical protein n=1 Tax=Microbacterium indicum TaxID=358100 RepID=UPI00041E0B4F|nr:hypothetical protein [Microbacterium indicum]